MERIDARDFEGSRLRRGGRYVVCFAAEWCPFCVRFLPALARFEGATPSRYAIADVSEESSPLWETFRISVVPMLVGFREGIEQWRIEGVLGVGLGPKELDRLRALDTGPMP